MRPRLLSDSNASIASPHYDSTGVLTSSPRARSNSQQLAVALEREAADPHRRCRLVFFLMMHFMAYIAEIAALVEFAIKQDWIYFGILLAPFFFSGLLCCYAAWICDAPLWGKRYLPLKEQPIGVALVLSSVLGFGQGIIVILALEEYEIRRGTLGRAPGAFNAVSRQLSNGNLGGSGPRTFTRFNCKAVTGLFEGLPFTVVILYAFWSMGDEQSDATHQHAYMSFLGTILSLSFGFGVMELDFCSSQAIARRMRRRFWYEVMHWIFRSTEVTSRISMHVFFMVVVHNHCANFAWLAPLIIDFILTFLAVLLYGGAETTWVVRLLCFIPATFVNIFQFVDSPYKRRAARRLSCILIVKHALFLFVLPGSLFAMDAMNPNFDLWFELARNWRNHRTMVVATGLNIVLYWPLLWWFQTFMLYKTNMNDIYTACEGGHVVAVRSAIRELTHSAAVGLNVNAFDTDGNTPLMLAVRNNHVWVCRLLLQEGARVDIRTFKDRRFCCVVAARRSWTALHIAAWRGHVEVIQLLLEAAGLSAHGRRDSRGNDKGGIYGQNEIEDAFNDEFDENPLHVAVRAGDLETVRVIAANCSRWASSCNTYGQRPIDLAKIEAVRLAISDPIADLSVGGRSSPLLLRKQAHAKGEDEDAWPQVQLSISRSCPAGGQLIAPGLCSYIATTCGGALGRVFLAHEQQPLHEQGTSVLTMISEADEGAFSLMPPDPRGGVAARAGGTGSSSWMASEATDGRSNPPPASSGNFAPGTGTGTIGPSIEDIEPVDRRSGEPIAWWLAMVQSNRLSIGPNASGRSLARVPDESILGQGSYGVVWRAVDRRTGHQYAVKNIISRRRSGSSNVALRECEVCDHIRNRPHPCIVGLFAVHNFQDLGLYVLVMEFCTGGDLLRQIRIAKHFSLSTSTYTPPKQALRWIGEVFLGLEHMHLRMDTLLRDLKPENVVLSASGCAKLTDFGFGRFGVESSGMWSFGMPAGSPGYVAPEVLRQEEYDSRADLYSLGVLVWVILTGGLVNRTEPIPPIGKMRAPDDFRAHFQDVNLLNACLMNPERNFARPLTADAKDFVQCLTKRAPSDRMRHDAIRRHRFLRPLNLPPFDAGELAVKLWLAAAEAMPEPQAARHAQSAPAALPAQPENPSQLLAVSEAPFSTVAAAAGMEALAAASAGDTASGPAKPEDRASQPSDSDADSARADLVQAPVSPASGPQNELSAAITASSSERAQ